MKGRVVFIVPARGGSKGIPNKNIIPVAGVPLLGWTIRVCKESSYYSDNIYVSSDSDLILEYSKKEGSNIVLRPDEISGDFSTSESAIEHAILEIEKRKKFDTVVFLQATSPIRHPSDINWALEKFWKEDLDSLFSSCVMEDFFYWKKGEKGLESVNYDFRNRKRRQDIEDSFLENGSFYIFKKDLFLREKNRLFGNIGTFSMENYKRYEIDNEEDLEIVEFYLNKIKNGIK